MEGIKSGWKKATRQYHYYNDDNTAMAICYNAVYHKSEFKELELFSEMEITPDMDLCPSCYSMRQKQIRNQIVHHHKESVGFWDDSCVCPSCKTTVIFFNNNSSKEHLCTVCNEMVVLA